MIPHYITTYECNQRVSPKEFGVYAAYSATILAKVQAINRIGRIRRFARPSKNGGRVGVVRPNGHSPAK